jgi:glucose-6-phosphate isomerase
MLQLDLSKLRIKSYTSLNKKLANISKQKLPAFDTYTENLTNIHESMKRFRKYRNLILIGNGGSNTSFKAYHHALTPLNSDKGLFILTTMEPDLINQVKAAFPKRKTLVMPVSKSGTTIGLLEAMFAFKGYNMLPVTSPDGGALAVIAEKEKFRTIPHPPIGGRYSGLTASALAPAAFFDIDIEKITEGARAMYKKCQPHIHIKKNPALQLAASLYLLEKKGYEEIFCPIYSSKLVGFENLIVQLMHESVCKKKQGQTIYCAEAPESQHHTNQRFFGGKKNVLGLFVTVESQDDMESKVHVPEAIKNIKVRDGKLRSIEGVPYAKALHYEFQGTYQDAVAKKIPVAEVSLDRLTPYSIGEFVAFWHYVAAYSSWLRGVDAFDQPQVESSKEISFKLRKEHHK